MSREPSKVRNFLVNHLNLVAATGVDDAQWEPFQIDHLDYLGPLRIENKSRQIAWSWTVAAEALAYAILDGTSTVFVSINLEEAMEKVRYARNVYENLFGVKVPKLSLDNKLGLEFDNGARIISNPAKPPRGKARFRVILDEYAHVQHDDKIYQGALPIISKGGVIRIGSSPMGASGMFYEIFTESLRSYPGYSRKTTPWWLVNYFCENIKEARKFASWLSTHDRVTRFGSSRIKLIYENMNLEDFQAEYECVFVDETFSWISWEDIRQVQVEELDCSIVKIDGDDVQNALEAIDNLKFKITKGKIKSTSIFAGLDIGRSRNATEFHIATLYQNRLSSRLLITLHNTTFDAQYSILQRLLGRLNVQKLLIDSTGLGLNFAENATREYEGRAEGVVFTNASKAQWAADAKTIIQRKQCQLPVDRELALQLHSVKRKVTANSVSFDADKTVKAHADKFWAFALCASAALSVMESVPFEVSVAKDNAQVSMYTPPVGTLNLQRPNELLWAYMTQLPPTIGMAQRTRRLDR